MKNGGEERI